MRPLTNTATGEISAAMSWTHAYTVGVLAGWKLGLTYCHAVLHHDERITLDGASAEPVDAKAKDLAQKRLATIAARKVAKAEKKVAKVPAAMVQGAAAPASPPTPEELRARVRASLFRPRA